MPEVIFNGPAGRLEGRYQPGKTPNGPCAIVLHPHPEFGGTMNNQVVYHLFYMFVERGFAVLRFNSRGVGRSQGLFDHGVGELSDAAAALDWLQSLNRESKGCWIAGFSFGAWIGMQLLMRRPEVEGFISVVPPENLYDFSFLAVFGPDHPRLGRPGFTARFGAKARRQTEDPERHHHRAADRSGRQPFLRGPCRGADRPLQRVSRPAPCRYRRWRWAVNATAGIINTLSLRGTK